MSDRPSTTPPASTETSADAAVVEPIADSPSDRGDVAVATEAAPAPGEAPEPASVESEGAMEAPAEPALGEGGAEAAAEEAAAPISDEEVATLDRARESSEAVEGTVIGWNNGGFHVVVGNVTAFCPRSEMEIGRPKAPKGYLDKSFPFAVLKIEDGGRRVVLSRAELLRKDRSQRRDALRGSLEAGAVVEGRVASLTDFGAFVDLGGIQGLVHVSEISRRRVGKPEEALQVGQKVQVKILKIEQGGKRISLSMKALEPDPWEGVRKRFSEGAVVQGTVEKVAPFGAFVSLEPGLTGLLPSSSLNLPYGSSLARMFPPGKRVSVQILSVDTRRKRISLAPEGSKTEGSRADFESYRKDQNGGTGFNALAAALERARKSPD